MRDLTNQEFERLTVISFSHKNEYVTPNGVIIHQYFWKCKCKCGKETVVASGNLTSKVTKSCGCLNRDNLVKHGLHKIPEYQIWMAIKQRCLNPKNKYYKNYGRRGITICSFLKESIVNFISVVGRRPSKSLDLGRIVNDKNYSCGNCEECKKNGWILNIRWETIRQNADNKRPKELEICGTTKSCYEWALELKALRESELMNKYIL